MSRKNQAENEYGVAVDESTVRFERLLPGPIERVWAYLTDSDKRAEWFAGGKLEPRVGGELELTFRHSTLTPHDETAPEKYRKYEGVSFTCRVTRYEPPHVLAHTFGQEEGGEVVFELSEAGDKVRLVLTHTRIEDGAAARNYATGWHSHLSVLTAKLNGRVPEPFWETHARAEAEYAKRLS